MSEHPEQMKDTGEYLAVPEDQRSEVDPDPEQVGEENADAYVGDYGLDEGEDVPLPEQEESGDNVERIETQPTPPEAGEVDVP